MVDFSIGSKLLRASSLVTDWVNPILSTLLEKKGKKATPKNHKKEVENYTNKGKALGKTYYFYSFYRRRSLNRTHLALEKLCF